MATYTITTTPVQEAALNAVVAARNAEIDAQNTVLAAQNPPGPPLSHTDNFTYLTQRIVDVLASYGNQHQKDIAAAALAAFQSAPQSAQGQILQLLGMEDYAALPPAALAKALQTIGLANFMALNVDQQNQAFTLAGLGA